MDLSIVVVLFFKIEEIDFLIINLIYKYINILYSKMIFDILVMIARFLHISAISPNVQRLFCKNVPISI